MIEKTPTMTHTRPTRLRFAALSLLALLSCVGDSRRMDVEPADACKAVHSGAAPFGAADLARGERRFESDCAECHSLTQSRKARPGPQLLGIVSRPIGRSPYHAYSSSLMEKGGVWTLDALDQYIEDPQSFIPGNRMRYRGLDDASDRLDLIAYLSCQKAAR